MFQGSTGLRICRNHCSLLLLSSIIQILESECYEIGARAEARIQDHLSGIGFTLRVTLKVKSSKRREEIVVHKVGLTRCRNITMHPV
jgi:hypothetical protein